MPGPANPEQPPSGPLYASETPSGGASGTQRGSGAASGPQTGAEGFEVPALRRALAVNAVGITLNAVGEWLPLSVRQAVADAVLVAVEPVAEHCVHDAGIHHRHHHAPVDGCPWCSETGTADQPDTIKTGGLT